MEHTATAERVTTIFAKVMGVPPANGLDTLPEDTESWDSLAQVRLFGAIEHAFGCTLPRQLLLIGPHLGAFATAIEQAR
ncbi:acyl carrier protein [Nonomuraea gerenzanensis]|uniref:Carrier domain-containing protein n=1 Tax=Nonomuraea gerenzanensis TaxID=93944 RepID=A0A1M4DYQ6_9ACTN|nr:acyl carrier protein [Nonomuraea gerenzanensis]UBU14007.1 acyl carrier protein [Nonomuraea gerenzanensis]SBO91691.1 hypothetical protein BN4615_P1205 [Nonomuraea gerenzanensis]